MMWLWQLIAIRRSEFLQSVLLWCVFSAIPLLLGYFNKLLFDSLSGARAVGFGIWTIIGLIAAAEVLQAAIGWLWIHRHLTFAKLTELTIQLRLAMRILLEPRPSLDSGRVLSVLQNDPRSLAQPVVETAQMVGQLLFAIGAFILMWQISPLVTVAVALPVLGVSSLVYFLRGKLTKLQEEALESTNQLYSLFGDTIRNIKTVKIFDTVRPILQNLDSVSDERMRKHTKRAFVAQLIASFGNNILSLGRGAILLLFAISVQSGQFTVGDFVLFTIYLEWLIHIPESVGSWLTTFPQAEASRLRLAEFMPQPERVITAQAAAVDPPPSLSGPLKSLQLVDFSASHPNGNGIRRVNLTVTAGTFTVITGKTGSGKSALLQALVGELPRTSGQVIWNGTEIEGLSAFMLPPRVAYAPQSPRMLSETVRVNVMLEEPGESDGNVLRRALEKSLFSRDLSQLAAREDTLIGPSGARLSGGQFQRLAVARMLARPGRLLIIDDVTSALDGETAAAVWRNIKKAGATVICATHSVAALNLADQIIELDQGMQVLASAV